MKWSGLLIRRQTVVHLIAKILSLGLGSGGESYLGTARTDSNDVQGHKLVTQRATGFWRCSKTQSADDASIALLSCISQQHPKSKSSDARQFVAGSVALFLLPAVLAVDLKDYEPGPVSVEEAADVLTVTWSAGEDERAQVKFDLRPGKPLLAELAVAGTPVLANLDPLFLITVGSRDLDKRDGWMIFFDRAWQRPHQSTRLRLSDSERKVRVLSEKQRVTVKVGPVSGGGFVGEFSFTFYPGTALIHAVAEVSTQEDARAILYDAGLGAESPTWDRIVWLDNRDKWQQASGRDEATAIAVRRRAVIAESGEACVAVFPPPHRFFYPLDFSDNLQFAWQGRGLKGTDVPAGFGVRQEPRGDRRWVPWFNAPPGTVQRLDVFYMLHCGSSADTFAALGRYTRNDRFKPLPGYQTFTSHYHVEHTLNLLKQRQSAPKSEQWRYTTSQPPGGWMTPEFDDRSWSLGKGAFGKRGTPAINIGTEWTSADIWLRRDFNLTEIPEQLSLRLFYDEDSQVYVNGVQVADVKGFVKKHVRLELSPDVLRVGRNTIAIHCWNDGGGQGIDASFVKQSNRIPSHLVEPGFVKVFRGMGVDIVHLAEFHNGRTPRLPASERLKQLDLMHQECRRLSRDDFLLLPGEEPNVHLGGHWISFFPKPVNWVLHRQGGAPFVEKHPKYGQVYHVGSAADVHKLLRQEQGLAWTAHARVKGSTGFPDRYRSEPFFTGNRFLGAAWKAMPADLSRSRLGWRVLDLLDDMNNWGDPKFALGEVDVFKVEPDHELYAHMNINYVKLDGIPRFDDGWQPLLNALRRGDFFVSTGEVLIPDCRLANSGLRADLEWTFPLAFAEIISGDGESTFCERLPLAHTGAFGSMQLSHPLDLSGRTWARLEVWDIAGNGAFTQPIRLR